MKLSNFVLTAAVLAATASFSLPSLAQDVRREDSVTYYLTMPMVDANKDGMVSKKEFLDAMSKTWDMHMAEAAKMDGDKKGAMATPASKASKQEMTRQQYIEFSKMFGLNIGS